MINNIKPLEKQSLLDVAVQQFGNADAVFSIIAKNDVDLSEQLPINTNIDLSGILPLRKEIVRFYSDNNIIPATDLTIAEFNELFEPMYIPRLKFKVKRFRPYGSWNENIPDDLLASWESDDLRFLNHNPEIWLFIERRRTRKLSNEDLLTSKKFGHTPHQSGVKYPNSAFYSGDAKNRFSKNFKTEFSLSQISGDFIQLPINLFDYFFYYDNDAGDYVPVGLNKVSKDLDVRTSQSKSRAINLKFAIAIDNPDKDSRYPKLFGDLSDTVTMYAERQYEYYHFGYKLNKR